MIHERLGQVVSLWDVAVCSLTQWLHASAMEYVCILCTSDRWFFSGPEGGVGIRHDNVLAF